MDPEGRASVLGHCFDGSGVTSPCLPRFNVSLGIVETTGSIKTNHHGEGSAGNDPQYWGKPNLTREGVRIYETEG